MSRRNFRSRIADSRLARIAAFPSRSAVVARHDAQVLKESLRWLIRRREHTNFTYDLSEANLRQLGWWVSVVADKPFAECHSWLNEILSDTALRQFASERVALSGRRGITDLELHVGRRAGWYAITRALRPDLVIETGTDKGLGSIVIASALQRNGKGHLLTIDVNPEAGVLIPGSPYASVITMQEGESLSEISRIDQPVDLFIHDSDHSPSHEESEYKAVSHVLSDKAIVLSDNSHSCQALESWSLATNRRFLFFREEPVDHWYPGGGIGAAWAEPTTASRNSP